MDPISGHVDLFHFAPPGTSDPFEADPKYFGRNPWSASERKTEGSGKTFHYVDLADKEGFFGGKPLFHTKYDASKIYDATKDADSHAERSHNVTALIDRLKEAGYHGVFYSGVFPTVAMWRPVAMKKIDEPQKLSRPVDSEHAAMLAATEEDKTNAPMLADMLQEKGVPGAHITRQSDPNFVYGSSFYAGRVGPLVGDDKSTFLVKDPERPTGWYIGHGANPNGRLRAHVRNLRHLAALLSDFPKHERAAVVRAAHEAGMPLGPSSEPIKLARMRAPAGGIIVNNQYQRGGQFMQRAFRRIRDVAARLVKLARSPSDYVDHAQTLGKDAPFAFADYLQENGIPGAHVARSHEGDIPLYWPQEIARTARSLDAPPVHAMLEQGQMPTPTGYKLNTFRLRVEHPAGAKNIPTMHRVLVRNLRHLAALLSDFPKEERARVVRAAHKRGMPLGPISEPIKLARPAEQTPTLPGSAFSGGDPVRNLTLGELKQMEDDHGIGQRHRLSPKVVADKPEEGDASTFRANKEHVARFLDALTNKRLVGHKLRTALTDPRRTDDQKAAYAALHMTHEAKEFLDATRANGAGEWYGEHVDDLEKTVHHVFGKGFEPGSKRQTLFKALVALSSSGTNPRDNALAAYRMMREGQKRRPDHPFLGVPAYNEPALRAWMEKAGPSIPTAPGHTNVDEATAPAAEHAWFVKHVLPRLAELHATPKSVGYQGRPAVIVDRPGHPDHGKLVEYTAGGVDHTTPEGGALYQRHRGKKALRKVLLPITDEAGRLKPKGWNAQGAQVERGVERLQKLIRTVGENRAAEFLLSPQKDSAFQRLFNYTPDRAQIGTDENLPGAFMFGPKFGAFLLNLHGNAPEGAKHAKWLTADKWWARSWNRFLGTLLHGAGRGAHVESPRGRAERNLMAQAAREATQGAGLRNVAELQAVMWYYEQALWRMLGVRQAKSYSFRDGAKAMLAAHKAATPVKISRSEGYRLVRHGYYDDEELGLPPSHVRINSFHPVQNRDGEWVWQKHESRPWHRSVLEPNGAYEHAVDLYQHPLAGTPLSKFERMMAGIDPPPETDTRPDHAIPEDFYA